VAEVCDHWPGEGHRYVRVRTPEGDLFLLRYDEPSDTWSVHLFEARGFEGQVPEHGAESDEPGDRRAGRRSVGGPE